MVDKLKTVFKTKAADGSEIELAVIKPTPKIIQESTKIANRAFADAAKSGALFKDKLEELLIEQGVWSTEKDARQQELQKEIDANVDKLKKGGISLEDAKALAIQTRLLRWERNNLISVLSNRQAATIEGVQDNARFDFLVSACVVYNNDGKPYFLSLDNYLERSSEQAAYDGAAKLTEMLYGVSVSDDVLPENEFLKKYKFINDDLRLVDKQGRLVNITGQLVNDAGDLVDESGNLVDADGKVVVENESLPFLDKEGNPILV